MDNANDSTFWGSVAAATAAIGAGIWKLMSSRQGRYDGPERRGEMKEVRKDLADLRKDLSVLQERLESVKESVQGDVLALKVDIQSFRSMQERFDARLRRGDRETARELGAMSEAFRKLEYMIAHERGWTRHNGVRGSSPPNGYMVAPPEDETPEPEGE